MSPKLKSRLFHIASISCVVHCIVTPIILIFAPFVGHIMESLYIEIGILSASILFGVLIVYNGYCAHKRWHSIILFSIGITLWGIHSVFEHYEIFGAKLYFAIGTCLVIGSYYVNHRFLKCCHSDN